MDSFAYLTIKPKGKKELLASKIRMVEAVNVLRRTRGTENQEIVIRAKGDAWKAYNEFLDLLGGEDAQDREWHALIWESNIESALGNFDDARDLDLKARSIAKTRTQIAISEINLADDELRLEMFATAEEHARAAFELEPTHAGFAVQVVTTLAMQGRMEEAAALLKTIATSRNPADIVNVHLRHEQLLRDRLPQLEEALEKLLSTRTVEEESDHA